MGLLDSVIGALANAQGGAASRGTGGGSGGLGGLGGLGDLGALLGGAGGGLSRSAGAAAAPAGGAAALAALLPVVLQLLASSGGSGGSSGGGLAGLVAQFERAGLGPQMASWIGTGQNLPVSPDQLQAALGPDALASVARQAGLPPADAGQALAQLLPELIDRFTPQGQAPAGGLGGVEDLLGALMRR